MIFRRFGMIVIPKNYKPFIDQQMTERAIKFVKDTFERELSGELKLSRVTSPLFVKANSGINDDLNGVERPVRFNVGNMNETSMESTCPARRRSTYGLSGTNML